MLLGGDPGHRLEPVRVVGRAVLDRPVLQRAGDDVGDRRVERFALRNRAPQRPVDVLGQPRPLDLVIERQGAKIVGHLVRGGHGPLAERRTPLTDAANGVAGGSGTHFCVLSSSTAWEK